MAKFGSRSKARLATCDEDLQELFEEVVRIFDCTVLCGHRGKKEQMEAYNSGNSNAKYPKGRHNKMPSMAVDVMRYPVNREDLERQTLFAGFVLGIAKQMGIDLIWGNDWDGDFDTKDTGLKDYPHFEVKEKK